MKPRPPKDKVKNKNVKISELVHKRLGKLGSVSEDYDDVVERLLDCWEEGHKEK
ncbi:MAG: hypothetical protein M3136_08835 [Thermoproteota archaeon]|nr:hypothetical protein [Thermoproteota archaeon]